MRVVQTFECFWMESDEIIIPVAHGSRAAVSGVEISATQERRQEGIGTLGWGRNEKLDLVKH